MNAVFKNLKHTFRALHHRNYRLYFTGQSVSLMGTWMQLYSGYYVSLVRLFYYVKTA
jgi:hypothetical protein